MTATDLRLRISAGRAMMNYVLAEERFDLFDGVNLNLNFPSVVGTVTVGEREIEYGYSSGIYANYVSRMTPIRSVPSQEEIDALGGKTEISAWERRFELASGIVPRRERDPGRRRVANRARFRPLSAQEARHLSQRPVAAARS